MRPSPRSLPGCRIPVANRVTDLSTERLGPAASASGGGTAEVPDLSVLPEPVLRIIQDVYGTATAELFLIGAPIALLALVAVVLQAAPITPVR